MRRVGLALAAVLLVAGCGAPEVGGGDAATAAARIKGGLESQAGAVQAVSTQAAAAATAATPAPGSAVKGATGMTPEQIGPAAQAEAARALNVPVDQVTVERVESVDWRDSSLGCAEPGKVYAQVITEGYRVIVNVGGQRREVHADSRGRTVFCPNPTQ